MRTRSLSPATLQTVRERSLFAPRRCPRWPLLCAGWPWRKLIARSIAFLWEFQGRALTVQAQIESIALRSQPGGLTKSQLRRRPIGALRYCWALRGFRWQRSPIQIAPAVLSFKLPIYVTLNRAQLAEILQ